MSDKIEELIDKIDNIDEDEIKKTSIDGVLSKMYTDTDIEHEESDLPQEVLDNVPIDESEAAELVSPQEVLDSSTDKDNAPTHHSNGTPQRTSTPKSSSKSGRVVARKKSITSEDKHTLDLIRSSDVDNYFRQVNAFAMEQITIAKGIKDAFKGLFGDYAVEVLDDVNSIMGDLDTIVEEVETALSFFEQKCKRLAFVLEQLEIKEGEYERKYNEYSGIEASYFNKRLVYNPTSETYEYEVIDNDEYTRMLDLKQQLLDLSIEIDGYKAEKETLYGEINSFNQSLTSLVEKNSIFAVFNEDKIFSIELSNRPLEERVSIINSLIEELTNSYNIYKSIYVNAASFEKQLSQEDKDSFDSMMSTLFGDKYKPLLGENPIKDGLNMIGNLKLLTENDAISKINKYLSGSSFEESGLYKIYKKYNEDKIMKYNFDNHRLEINQTVTDAEFVEECFIADLNSKIHNVHSSLKYDFDFSKSEFKNKLLEGINRYSTALNNATPIFEENFNEATELAAHIKNYKDIKIMAKYSIASSKIDSGEFESTWTIDDLIDTPILKNSIGYIDFDQRLFEKDIISKRELGILQYLYGEGDAEGIARAKEFLEDYTDTFNKRIGQKDADEFYAYLTSHPDIEFVKACKSFGKGFGTGLGDYCETIKNVFSPDVNPTASEYAKTYLIDKLTTVKGKTDDVIAHDKLYYGSYTLGSGLGEKVIPITASIVGGPKLTLALSTAHTFGANMRTAVRAGADYGEAFGSSTLKIAPSVLKSVIKSKTGGAMIDLGFSYLDENLKGNHDTAMESALKKSGAGFINNALTGGYDEYFRDGASTNGILEILNLPGTTIDVISQLATGNVGEIPSVLENRLINMGETVAPKLFVSNNGLIDYTIKTAGKYSGKAIYNVTAPAFQLPTASAETPTKGQFLLGDIGALSGALDSTTVDKQKLTIGNDYTPKASGRFDTSGIDSFVSGTTDFIAGAGKTINIEKSDK